MAGSGGESDSSYSTDVTSNPIGSRAPRRNALSYLGKAAQLLNLTQRVESTQIELFTASSTKGKAALSAAKSMSILNDGDATLGVVITFTNWKDVDEIGDGIFSAAYPAKTYMHMLLPKNEAITFPTARVLTSTGETDGSGGTQAHKFDGTAISNQAPDANMYKTVTSDHSSGSGDQQLDGAIDSSTSTTTVTVDDGSYFVVGDLIQLGTEIMEVTAVSGQDLTVIRAVHGSTIASHSDNANIRFPFFNAYHDFDKLSTARTDHDGKFKATNFFGYGRAANYIKTGILPGSVAIKCYNPGYQELGLSGITAGTKSGLTAGATYDFTIAVDGGSAFETAFTVDSNNTNFGGRNGVLSKIQTVFNEAYYTSGNLFEKKVTVGIVNGDIRFTSGSYLSTSAIALGTEASGDTDLWGSGRIPALATFTESAVAARLPDDTITDPVTGDTISNTRAFLYDDGEGNLIGNGRGTINYDTGAIDFVTKPNAEFVISANYSSPLTGKLNADYKNVISEVRVHSANPKITGKVSLVIGG